MRRNQQAAKGQHPTGRLLVALFVLAEERITNILRRVISGKRSQRELLADRNLVHVELAKVNGQVPQMARAAVQSAFSIGNGSAEKLLEGQPQGRVSGINTKSATILADNLIADLQGATTAVGRRVDDVFRREGLRAALHQIEHELPPNAAYDLMAKALERQGLTAFTDKGGRKWNLTTYTQMAVRTVSAEALAHGTAETMIERGFDLAKVSEHACKHHPKDPENPCRALEGRIVSLTGQTGGYPHLSELPPFHPNCSHFILPAVEGVVERRERLAAVA